ncbi:MAG: hypothetical protein A2735_03060 [Candidatus Yanofskybacteria bacterium RIFCSPHIGHO2_01_FULL_41_21]|uniref:Uncharacterized protein n=1 Tax=Candidatus Yanofskybacteria bacterium RIFCSPHIGHO2_01_FULL_41_21 TaxID=1802660 RepID=A0A1F8E958_9BACT|nr:MAG: hypothetical protein A2735_03060 [Candidatus Yanofskybacteria bacterium RIFCSPHIGHO2_01_FULL_41_21]
MNDKNLICGSCGHTNPAKRVTRGTFLAEITLWVTALFLLFAIPFIGGVLIVIAIVYSVWRLLSRRTKCQYCGNTNLIPINSPIGKKLLEKLENGKESEKGNI